MTTKEQAMKTNLTLLILAALCTPAPAVTNEELSASLFSAWSDPVYLEIDKHVGKVTRVRAMRDGWYEIRFEHKYHTNVVDMEIKVEAKP